MAPSADSPTGAPDPDTRAASATSAIPASSGEAPLAGARVLVTGSSGFIGGSVVAALQAAGAQVRGVDLPGAEPVTGTDQGIEIVAGDLRDPAVVAEAVTAGFDGIVHLAARTRVLQSVQEPHETTEHNVLATANLLERAREVGVPRFFMASTNAVTGDVGTATISEDLPLRPLTPYGGTKAACEMLMSGYGASYGMQTCALRLTNVYGPGMVRKDSFVPRLMRAARDGAGVRIHGDGMQRRDLVHTADVCRALLLAWAAGTTGPLIVGSGRSITVLDMVEAARTATGRELPVEHIDAKAGEMPAVIVSVARAEGIGYRPQVALTDGFAGVWNEFAAAPAPQG